MGGNLSVIPPEVTFLTRDEVAHMIQELGPDYRRYARSFWHKEIDGTRIMEAENLFIEEIRDILVTIGVRDHKHQDGIMKRFVSVSQLGSNQTGRGVTRNLASHTAFETRGVSLELLMTVRAYALSINRDAHYWTFERVGAYLIGNYELLIENNRWGVEPNSDEIKRTLTFKPQSQFSGSSLIEILREKHTSQPHPQLNVLYDSVVSNANVYLSYANKDNYVELVNALEYQFLGNSYELNRSSDNTFFYFDLFVNNQWIPVEYDPAFWSGVLTESIKGLDQTYVYFPNWKNSPAVLQRTWCLYEISCNDRVHVVVDVDDDDDSVEGSFSTALREDIDSVISAMCRVDLGNSTTYKQEDKANVIRAVKNKGENYEEFNCRASRYIRKWIYDILLKRAGKENTLSHRISLNIEKAESFVSLLQYHNKLKWLLRRCEDKLEEYTRHTIDMDDNKAIYINNIATLYYHEKRYDEVLLLLKEVLEYHSTRMTAKEEDNSSKERRKHRKLACNALFDLACVYRKKNMFTEAAKHYEMALEGFMQLRMVLSAMDTIHYTALMLVEDFAQLDDAETLLENALEEKERLLGDWHLSTIDTAYCLACILYNKKEYSASLRLFHRAKRARAQFFGPDNNLAITTDQLTQQCEKKVRSMMFVNSHLSQLSQSHKSGINPNNSVRAGLQRGVKVRNSFVVGPHPSPASLLTLRNRNTGSSFPPIRDTDQSTSDDSTSQV